VDLRKKLLHSRQNDVIQEQNTVPSWTAVVLYGNVIWLRLNKPGK
jgi:hypothetical protein